MALDYGQIIEPDFKQLNTAIANRQQMDLQKQELLQQQQQQQALAKQNELKMRLEPYQTMVQSLLDDGHADAAQSITNSFVQKNPDAAPYVLSLNGVTIPSKKGNYKSEIRTIGDRQQIVFTKEGSNDPSDVSFMDIGAAPRQGSGGGSGDTALESERVLRLEMKKLESEVLSGKWDPNKPKEVRLKDGSSVTINFDSTAAGQERLRKIAINRSGDDYRNLSNGLLAVEGAIAMLEKDPNVYRNPVTRGLGIGDAGTFESLGIQAVDSAVRLATGAALNTTEQGLYARAFGANWYNDPETVQFKLKALRDIYREARARLEDPYHQETDIREIYNRYAPKDKGTGNSGMASNLSSKDAQALNWAKNNPKDPRSAAILKRLGR